MSAANFVAFQVYAFLQIFFETFKEKFGDSYVRGSRYSYIRLIPNLDRDFFIAGESYAGRYAPLFADYIVVKNQEAELKGKPKINLKGVLIGNGL